MPSSLLRDCFRLGVSVLGLASHVVAEGKKKVQRAAESYLQRMGFVSRDEFEALSESFRRSQEAKKPESPKRDQK